MPVADKSNVRRRAVILPILCFSWSCVVPRARNADELLSISGGRHKCGDISIAYLCGAMSVDNSVPSFE
jgi:hypothetical protein